MKQIHKYPKHIQELYEAVIDAQKQLRLITIEHETIIADAQKQLRIAVCSYEEQYAKQKEDEARRIKDEKIEKKLHRIEAVKQRDTAIEFKKGRKETIKYLKEFYKEHAYYICRRWCDSDDNLIADMGTMPGPDYYLSRHDSSKFFMPGNCYWKRRN